MNAIQFLASQPWVERLGWTLVHFIWQGLLMAACYAAARRWMARSASSNARYLLACGALAAMVAAPLATWSAIGPPSTAAAGTAFAGRVLPLAATPTIAVAAWPIAARAGISQGWSAECLPWIVAAWLAGAMMFCLRLMGAGLAAARMQSTLVRPAPPEWQQALSRLGARIGLVRPVRLLVSSLAEVPSAAGWLRPVVLVPAGALAGLPAGHLEALLIHELAHIRRHDYLVNILESVAEALLFYHPAVWWVSGHIRAEREHCCDDIAASATGDALTYAHALVELESRRPAHAAVMAADGGSLADRIARLLGQSRPVSPTHSGWAAALSAILLAIAACGLFAQADSAPRFEVASIKLNTGDRSGMRVRVLPGGGLMSQNAPLQMLMQNAYTLQAFQIVGGPEWVQSEGYNIEAKGGDKSSSRAEVFLKLRSLLEDRFQLKYHRETREQPVYALTVAKNGPKLPPPKEGSCMAGDPTGPPRPAPGGRLSPPCGNIAVMGEPSGVRMQGGQVPMAELTRILAMVMGRPVIDKTGITEKFDLVLEFTPDEAVAGLRPQANVDAKPPVPAAADPDGLPHIFSAIQEQLGLKLESSKGPVEVLVIDHVERPSAN